MNVFIDTNILDVIEELELLPVKLNYFYPNVDAFQLKPQDIKEINNNPSPNAIYYYQSVDDRVRKALKIIQDYDRFHLVMRAEQEQTNQTYDSNGQPVTHMGFNRGLSERSKNKIKSIYDTLGRETGRTSTDKDLAVLTTFIFCGDRASSIIYYDQELTRWIDFSKKISVYNPDGKKYFITKDKKGVFKQNAINKIEQAFPDIKIFSLSDFKKDYLKYI